MFYMTNTQHKFIIIDLICNRTQNSELRILFNLIHEDCNKLAIVTILKITVIKGKKI